MPTSKSAWNFKSCLTILLISFVLFTCGIRTRKGANCWDGSHSSATGSGACSHHHGVRNWKHDYWWNW